MSTAQSTHWKVVSIVGAVPEYSVRVAVLLCLSEVRLPVAGRYRIQAKTQIDITLPQRGPQYREESSVPLVRTTMRVYHDKMM